jgi:type II secretory pathway component PulC
VVTDWSFARLVCFCFLLAFLFWVSLLERALRFSSLFSLLFSVYDDDETK